MKKFSILIPTRKRIKLLTETLFSLEKQTKNKDLFEIIFGIDDDDVESKNFLENYAKKSQMEIVINITKRGKGYQDQPFRLKEMILLSRGEYLMHYADDMKILTYEWDIFLKKNIDKLPKDKIYLIFPEHNQNNIKWPLIQIISRKWFDSTGKFTNCIETDTELLIISTLLKRTYKMNEIKTTHAQEKDVVFSEGREKMFLSSPENSIFSIKNFFLILIDYQKLKIKIDKPNKKNFKTVTFDNIKYFFISFLFFFYYLNIIKKELKFNPIKKPKSV